MEETEIPPPPTPIIIQLYENLGDQLLDIVEERCGDSRIVSSVCPSLTEAQHTVQSNTAGKSVKKAKRTSSIKSSDCKLASKGGEFPQKVKQNNGINVDNESIASEMPSFLSENCKIKLKPIEGNFSHSKGSNSKVNAAKPKMTAQENTRVQKGEKRSVETLPKITVSETGNRFKGGGSLQNRQSQKNTRNKGLSEKKGTHLDVTMPNVRLQDKGKTLNRMSPKMAESLNKNTQPRGGGSRRDDVNNDNLSAEKTAKTPRKNAQRSNDVKSEVLQKTAQNSGKKPQIKEQRHANIAIGTNKTLRDKKESKQEMTTEETPVDKNNTEKKALKLDDHSKEDLKPKGAKPSSTSHSQKESGTFLEKKEKENLGKNVGAKKSRDDMNKGSADTSVGKKWSLGQDTSRFAYGEVVHVPPEETVEQKDVTCTSKPPILKNDPPAALLTEENGGDDKDTKQDKKVSIRETNTPKPLTTKEGKTKKLSRETPKRNLNSRLCEVVKKGDKNVPKYKDIHLNVKEKKSVTSRAALEVTSMQCEELKEANMYLTKILGVEKNARTIQLIDQMQRHQKTLEAELEKARKKETLAEERAEKAERQANDISQQVEQVRRSRDKVVTEKEQLLQDLDKERKAFEKVRQHVDSVGKMRQRAHQVKENALRQRNKLAQEVEAERAKMSAMSLAMKDVNTQKFNAERRRLNMVRIKNKLAKERDEERAKLRELHETIEEMKKEKDEAVKQKYRALKQRDQARTTCRKLNGELKGLRESVESLNESGCYVLETTERLTVVENSRPSAMTNSKDKVPRSRFPSIDNKRGTQMVLNKSQVPHPGVPNSKHPAKLPQINQRPGAAESSPVRSRYSRPAQYDLQNHWSSSYSHDVTESDRSGADFYDWGFYDDDHLPPVNMTRHFIPYPDLQATGTQRTLANRSTHAAQWKKYPTGETLASHPHLGQPPLPDNGFHSNADGNFEESDATTTESSRQGNTVDRQVSAHLDGLANDPRAHVTGYHGNMVDRQVSAHLDQWGCRRAIVDQSDSVKLPFINSDELYRQSAFNQSMVATPPRIKLPKL